MTCDRPATMTKGTLVWSCLLLSSGGQPFQQITVRLRGADWLTDPYGFLSGESYVAWRNWSSGYQVTNGDMRYTPIRPDHLG